MADKLQDNTEWLSALVDGQLRDEEFAQAVERFEADEAARAAWDNYHLVGEAMRLATGSLRAHDTQFVQNLRQKIAKENPTLIAQNEASICAKPHNPVNVSAANEGQWRRVAGLASVVLVGVLAWQAYLLTSRDAVQLAQPQLAQMPTQSNTTGVSKTLPNTDTTIPGSARMLRDPRLDAMLAAHRQLGGAGALQMSSGFLRNATFNEGNR